MRALPSFLHLALAAALAVAAPPEGAASACEGRVARDVVSGAGAFGEVRLASGRSVILADIGPGDPALTHGAAIAEGARAFIAAQAGVAAEVRVVEEAPDRWGRVAAAIVLAPDAAALDLAHALVARGLAVVDPGARARLCDPELLRREEQARRAGRGLWREAAMSPLPASDPAALLARVGSFTLVEGTVRRVGIRGRRTYLDFGGAPEGAFTIIVPADIWTRLEEAGLGGASLKGRRIRVRGIMQEWRGPAIELMMAELIETLEARPVRQ